MQFDRSTFPCGLSRLFKLTLLATAALLTSCADASHGIASHDVVFDNVHFRVAAIDLARANLSLHWRDPATGKPFASIHALQAWGTRHGQRLLFAANAGIYDAHGEPLGLFVENGKTITPLNTAHGNPAAGNFSLLPNGVFTVDADGHASVRTTGAYTRAESKPRIATQSGPMLVIDGEINPKFVAGSDSLKWRSGVCAPTPSKVLFVVSTAPVNFYTFAALLRDKFGCRAALYLDGTLSQIYDDGSYYGAPAFMVKPYAGIFAVFVPAP